MTTRPAEPELPAGAARDRGQQNAARAAIYAAPEFKRHRLVQVVALRLESAINHQTGWTFISQERIAADLGIRRQAVQGALAALTGRGVHGDSYRPALTRPYFHAVAITTGRKRTMTYHCLAAVPVSTVSPVDPTGELQSADSLSCNRPTASPAIGRQSQAVAKSLTAKPSEAVKDCGSTYADAAVEPCPSPEVETVHVPMNLPPWLAGL